MSTRALVGIYVNGKLTKFYFHHWDGYLNGLGNMLQTFVSIVGTNLNERGDIPYSISNAKVNTILKKRSGPDMLKKFFDLENGFCDEGTTFSDWWCLEYIYRINFTFDPKASYSKWDVSLDYTKEIAPLPEKWKEDSKFTPLIEYEGVHYITETNHERPIHELLYGKVANRELPSKPEPEAKSA